MSTLHIHVRLNENISDDLSEVVDGSDLDDVLDQVIEDMSEGLTEGTMLSGRYEVDWEISSRSDDEEE